MAYAITFPNDHNALPPALKDQFTKLLGPRFTTAAAAREQHGHSETHHQDMPPDAVVFPHSNEEVVAIVRACAAHAVPIVPFGVGTSVEGNFAAVRGGVCIDMSGMNKILAVRQNDFDCTVQAGVRRNQLNEYLRDQGLFFPIDPGADATIGGMASTRASGTNAVRYGTMQDNVLALKVVTADGREIVTSSRARKSAAGYDLTRLFVGSEGTLGVITEVTLRLRGIPEAIASAVCGFDTLDGAVNAVVQTIQLGVPVARVEILDDVQMRAVNRWSKLSYPEVTTLFFEFHGSDRYVKEQAETVAEIAAENGGGAFQWTTNSEERSALWKARHDAFYAAVGLRPGAIGWPTDVCVPISRLADCIRETKADLETTDIPAPILGHVGDGNFHVIFVIDPNKPDEIATAKHLNNRLVERALAMGGTCTGEHGIGLGKIDALQVELGEAVDIMRTIKRALDPQDIMNPGKIFTR
ncbi:MAG TPA: FAD-linked oxidase C-terminal domain-containing protein [Rhizomicrobium sp.]|jgi:D-lactate dehydrogenase (cytochrome)